MKRLLILAFSLSFLSHAAVSGQQRSALSLHATTLQQTGASALATEAAGATIGSLIGFGAVYLTREGCDADDLGCVLERVSVGLVLSTVGAAAGAHLAGNWRDTQPSGWGATLGAIVGAAGGLGAWHLFTEELDISNDPAVAILGYSLTQGIFTAIGSRIGKAMR